MAKLSISRAWDETKAIIAHDGKLIGTLALAMFVLPGLILNAAMPEVPADQLPPVGVWLIIAVVAILLSMVGQLAVIRMAIGPHISVGDAIRHGAARLLPYLGAALLWTVPLLILAGSLYEMMAGDPEHPSALAALGFLIVFLAGIYLTVRLILMSAVASAHQGGPLHVLKETWHASAGNWWRLFGFLLLYAIGAMALMLAVASVLGLLARTMLGDTGPLTIGGLVVSIVSQLVAALVSTVFFVMLARLYAQRSDAALVSVPSSGT